MSSFYMFYFDSFTFTQLLMETFFFNWVANRLFDYNSNRERLFTFASVIRLYCTARKEKYYEEKLTEINCSNQGRGLPASLP